MKVTLISPYPDITAFGLRTISAYLKAHGHKTQMIFLPVPYSDSLSFGVRRYEDHIIDELISLCKNSDLIAITLMTNFFNDAVQITRKLKNKIDVPIIWGGVHTTIRPEESLEHAGIVCVGDGEEALLELADKMEIDTDYSDTPNLWIKSNGKTIKNALRPLSRDLDIYPPPDYSMEDHHIMTDRHIRPLTPEIMKLFLKKRTPFWAYVKKIGYQTMTSRGCLHKCAYCINDTIKNLYHGQVYLRWRSTAHIMEELLFVKEYMPYVGYMLFSDDNFFARSLINLEKFCNEYKQKITLPFGCLANPLEVTEKKLEVLLDAGLIHVQMGLESGSRKIQELFNRKSMSNERMMKSISIINKFKEKMYPPRYDFILDTPYETDEDKLETLRFISEIPKPFYLNLFSLSLYPGTKIYEMAKADGYINNEKLEIYEKISTITRQYNYFNLLITLAKGGNLPSPFLRFLINDLLLKILSNKTAKSLVKYFFIALRGAYHFVKKALK